MKIILTGATGFIGNEVLQQCIKHIYITHIFAISRKPLDAKLAKHPKVTEILHEDFEHWPSEQLEELAEHGVGGCIWCVGGAIASFKDYETAQRTNVALPLQAAEAFATFLAPTPSSVPKKGTRKQPFRFLYMSVAGAEQDSFRSLWSQAQTRKMKGAAEKGLFELADGETYQGMFEVYALRLGKVLPGGQTVANILSEAVSSNVSVERVGRFCINTVLDGRTEEAGGRICESAQILGDDWSEINTQSL